MGQASVVTDFSRMRDSGRLLLDELVAAGLRVDVAFWADADGDGKPYLYLATPAVVERGVRGAYRAVLTAAGRLPRQSIDPFEVKVINPAHPMARAALAVITLTPESGPFAANREALPTMTRFGGSSLGGVQLENGAYIYPPYPPGLATP